MGRRWPACKHCQGPLSEPLPHDMIDERLAPQGIILRCAKCGRAGIVDNATEWRHFEEDQRES